MQNMFPIGLKILFDSYLISDKILCHGHVMVMSWLCH
jgi:hypothetical protein